MNLPRTAPKSSPYPNPTLRAGYGGIDGVLLWSSYPNLGVDTANQFDSIRFLPGGIAGLLEVTQQFHARGVFVGWPYNPWDQGTREEPMPDNATIAALLSSINADFFNGDTMYFINETYWNASIAAGHPLAMQPEIGPAFAGLAYTKLGWGEGWTPDFIPQVDIFRWLEPRHQTEIVNRWALDHTTDLQQAFFNGTCVCVCVCAGVGLRGWLCNRALALIDMSRMSLCKLSLIIIA